MFYDILHCSFHKSINNYLHSNILLNLGTVCSYKSRCVQEQAYSKWEYFSRTECLNVFGTVPQTFTVISKEALCSSF